MGDEWRKKMNHQTKYQSGRIIKKTGIRIFTILLDLFLFPFFLLAGCVQICCGFWKGHGRIRDMWRAWFLSYVPTYIHDESVLGIFSLLSFMDGLPKEEIQEHLCRNTKAWNSEAQHYRKSSLTGKRGSYIEYQEKMVSIKYGSSLPAFDALLFGEGIKLCGSLNTCEVIALYNALISLYGIHPPHDFPSLLAQFEHKGIVLGGYFGTSPDRIQAFLDKECKTKMLTGRQLTNDALLSLSKEYEVYIMTAYNNRRNIAGQIHTVCITKETEGFQIHNGDHYKVYETLFGAVKGYHGGEGRAICVVGAGRMGD